MSCSSADGGAAPDGPEVEVAVVSDSEIAPEVIDMVDGAPSVDVSSAFQLDGATMSELDEAANEAIAGDAGVLLYAGGTNDLPSGPALMLEGLTSRLRSYSAERCVVVAVPVFRYEAGTEAEVAERTAGTRVLEEAVADAGATVVSYLDVSRSMAAEGEDFFAEGELGDLHPGQAAHARIAEAIGAGIDVAVAASVDGCGTD
ncbi:MAG: SGNH/GDSL hydrolase family protein [Acidimicrobiales bacterium]|nr:SGNH/GDSL hydrolase family protein [Acidimicrobiales bacterium]